MSPVACAPIVERDSPRVRLLFFSPTRQRPLTVFACQLALILALAVLASAQSPPLCSEEPFVEPTPAAPLNVASDGPFRLAVRFTVPVASQISGIRFWANSAYPGPTTVELFDSGNLNTPLASGTVTPAAPGFVVVNFASTASVSAGVDYYASFISPNPAVSNGYIGKPNVMPRTPTAYVSLIDSFYGAVSLPFVPSPAMFDVSYFVEPIVCAFVGTE